MMKFIFSLFLILVYSNLPAQTILNESISTYHSSENSNNLQVSSAVGETVYKGGTNTNNKLVEGSIQPHLDINIGISEIKSLNMSIFPNPTSSDVFIESQNSDEQFKGQIISIDGKLLKKFEFSKNYTLDLSSYSTGNYMIRIQTSKNKQNTYQIIKH